MNEYAIGVFAICLTGGALMKLSYSSGNMSRLAVAIITVYVIVAPAASAIKNADFGELFEKIEVENTDYGEEYGKICKDALEKGICAAVSKEFSLDEGNVKALAYGFNAEKMSAESIKVILSGRAAMFDCRLIEEYLNKLNIGRCVVEIEIG